MGYTPDAIGNYMTLLGWSVPEGMEERFSLAQAAEVFSFDRVNKAGARFDWDKLNWLNAQVLHALSPEQLLDASNRSGMSKAGLCPAIVHGLLPWLNSSALR